MHFLITTRQIDIHSEEAEQIKLNVLKATDAPNLVREFLDQPSTKDIQILCNELGNHVLVLRQAIAYIKVQGNSNSKTYGIKNYIADLAKDKGLLRIQVNHIDGYSHTISLIVLQTLKTIKKKHGAVGKKATELMKVLCLTRSDGISMKSFLKITEPLQSLYQKLKWRLGQLGCEEIVLLLKKYSLIFCDEHNYITIHRVIQKVAKSNSFRICKRIIHGISTADASNEDIRQLISIWDNADPDVAKEYPNFPIRILQRMSDLSMVFCRNELSTCYPIIGTRPQENFEDTNQIGP